MTITVPYAFRHQSGRVPAREIDDDFSYLGYLIEELQTEINQVFPSTVLPTAGGVGVASTISSAGLSAFGRSTLGLNGRQLVAYYHGIGAGQDVNDGIALLQANTINVALTLNGRYPTVVAQTYITLTSSGNLSGITYTITGISGGVLTVETIAGPNAGRVITTHQWTGTPVSIVPNGSSATTVKAGWLVTPSNIELKYSDDGGTTYSPVYLLDDGLVSLTTRGYQVSLAASRSGAIWAMWVHTEIATGVITSLIRKSSDNGTTFASPQQIVFTGLLADDTRVIFYTPWRQLADDSFISCGQGDGQGGLLLGARNTYTMRSDFEAVAGVVTIACTLIRTCWHATTGQDVISLIDTPNSQITIPDAQTVTPIAGMMVSVNGSSSGGNPNADGVRQIVSVVHSGGTYILKLTPALTGGTASGSTKVSTNFVLGEIGFDIYNNLDMAIAFRVNAAKSQIPIMASTDAGVTWNYIGGAVPLDTSPVDDGFISITLDFVPVGQTTMLVIGGYNRGSGDSFFFLASDVIYALTSVDFYSPLYYWLTASADPVDTGYPSNIIFGDRALVSYTRGVTLDTAATVETQVVELAPVLSYDPTADFARYEDGFYYGSLQGGTAASETAVDGRLYCMLMPTPGKAIDVLELGVFVRTAVGVNATCQLRFAAYEDTGNTCADGSLLFDTGVINMVAATSNLYTGPAVFTLSGQPWWGAFIVSLNGGGGNLPGIEASSTPGVVNNLMGNSNGKLGNFTRYLYADFTANMDLTAFPMPDPCPTLLRGGSTVTGDKNSPQFIFKPSP